MSEYVSVAETAKLVRRALKREFPGVRFSVRSNRYSGGASIDVGWTDGPQRDTVDKVVRPYSGADFDGMTDSTTYHATWLYPDGTVRNSDGKGARLVHFMADYVFTERTFSAGYRERLERAVVFLAGDPGPFDGYRRYGFGLQPGGRWFEEYGNTLVYQLSQVDEAEVEAAMGREEKRRAAAGEEAS